MSVFHQRPQGFGFIFFFDFTRLGFLMVTTGLPRARLDGNVRMIFSPKSTSASNTSGAIYFNPL
jgi:hypothetical protein